MKKIFLKLFCCFILLFLLYLLIPSPAEPPPLPDSRKSTEPGDTIEIPGLFAYYTNMSRQDTISFYRKYFSQSKLFGIPLLTYRLNHPPEYVWEVIRDTIHSSFLEELVHPFRESLYINGYEPENDPFNKTGQKYANFSFDNKEYSMKVIVYRKGSNSLIRLGVFSFALFCFWLILKMARKIYEDIRHNR